MKQKLFRGDTVKIAYEMPGYMDHFPAGSRATVLHSYADRYNEFDKDDPKYAVTIKGIGHVSWYPQSLLTLVKKRDLRAINKLDRVRR